MPKKNLGNRLGVSAGSPSAASEPHSDPDPEQGNKSGDPEAGGRTLDNVVGELRRRQDDWADRMESRFDSFKDELREIVSGEGARGSSGDSTQAGSGQSRIADLRAARDQEADPAKRQQWNDLILEELASARAQEAVQRDRQQRNVDEIEQRANQEAVQRYPDLMNSQSEMYQRVQAELARRPDGDRPGVVLDVANDVALSMGKSPITGQPSHGAPPVARGNGSGKPVNKSQDDLDEELGVIDDEELLEIARRLGPAMRSGEFSKEQLESVKNKDRELKGLVREFGPGIMQG